MNMLRKVISVGALATILVLSYGVRANADTIQLSCATCSSGSTTLVSTGGSVTFSFIGQGTNATGDAFIGIVVPSGGGTPTLSSGTLGPPNPTFSSGALGDAGNLNEAGFTDFNLSNFRSASSQGGVSPSSYTVFEYDLGPATLGGGTGTLSSITAGNLANGTVIVGWLETTSTTSLQTPLSESITTVPEPGSLVLFGCGLLGLGVFLRRRAIPYSQV